MVYDSRNASDDINSVMSMANDVESGLENTRHDNPSIIYSKLPPFVRRFLDYEVDGNGMMHMVRRQNAFTSVETVQGCSSCPHRRTRHGNR